MDRVRKDFWSHYLIFFGGAAAIGYWLLESFFDSFIQGVNSFTRAFLSPPWYELCTRIMVSVLFIVGAGIFQRQMKKRLFAEAELEKRLNETKFFAYSVSHDLKSPAIAVHGIAKLLAKSQKSGLDKKGREYCRQIIGSAEAIMKLVESVNVFIATSKLPLKWETFKLAELCQEIKDEFSIRLEKKGISFEYPDAPVELKADRLLIARALRNFIANALDHGRNLKRISVGYETGDGCHILHVSDDGELAGELDEEKIFAPFKRGRTAQPIPGAGMGLAIVKEIAKKHGGEAWFVPQPERGITFFISIAKNN
jgi:signal transduction histidine kinase